MLLVRTSFELSKFSSLLSSRGTSRSCTTQRFHETLSYV
ncbi:hypothetical protein AKJ16_DCAP19071 [Drosera capensis]